MDNDPSKPTGNPQSAICNLQSAIENVFLIGYRGTGKSTVAQLLAHHLGWPWVDADDVLEKRPA